MRIWENFIAVLRDALTRWSVSITVPIEATGYRKVEPKLQDMITVERMNFTDTSTTGELHIDGELYCRTLELSCRKPNKDGKLAIPMGKYEMIVSLSPHLGYETPELLNVPGRTGIRIHIANWSSQLEGCIAVGMRADPEAVYDSKKAFEPLLSEIKKRLTMGKVYVSVIGGGQKEVV